MWGGYLCSPAAFLLRSVQSATTQTEATPHSANLFKAQTQARAHTHTVQFSYCTVCCLLWTIHRTNQLITASVHRNPIPSKGHSSIQRFPFFPVLSHPLLFFFWSFCHFSESIPFCPLPTPASLLLFSFWGFRFEPYLPLSWLPSSLPITHPGPQPTRGSWLWMATKGRKGSYQVSGSLRKWAQQGRAVLRGYAGFKKADARRAWQSLAVFPGMLEEVVRTD